LLQRRASPIDRRRQLLHLTAAGSAALADARAAVAAHEIWLKARFTAEEVGQLVALLRRIYQTATQPTNGSV
jgi:DNA-binding MarR family transcriptional regulator